MKPEYYNKSKGVLIERIPAYTEEWYQRRLMGVGASECGIVLGHNDYKGSSVIELFYQKLGRIPQFRDGNKFTFWGNILESPVADVWQYYDGTDDGYIQNMENDNKMRTCHRINGFLVNEKYPHLYASLDRVSNKGSFMIVSGEVSDDGFPVEVKTLASWVAKKWEEGIPPMYRDQVCQQAMCLGVKYGELAALELDTRRFSCYGIILTNEMRDFIEEATYSFWYKMVEPALKLKREYDILISRDEIEAAARIEHEISNFEPPHDSSESYKDYMNQRWLSEKVEILAPDDIIEAVFRLKAAKDAKKIVAEIETKESNAVREFMRENDTLKLGHYGTLTWRTSTNGTRTMRVEGVKLDIDAHILELEHKIKSHISLIKP